MEDLKTYDWAIKDAQRKSDLSPRYLLLGNGFSIGCHEGFGQGKIRKHLEDKGGFQELLDAFDKDEDPEQILRALENAVQVVKTLRRRSDKAMKATLDEKTQAFKNAFITAIAKQHPERQSDIGARLTKCREFLAHFLDQNNQDGAVYTLNYDLLLYWAIMWDYNQNEIAASDGFSTVGGVLKWTGKLHDERRDVYYLHGALHFYNPEENVLKKHKWGKKKSDEENLSEEEKKRTILDKVKESLENKEYPLFIAGGTHHQKLHDIQQVPYLKTAHDRFKAHMDKNEGCLFLYGVSLSENDQHIWDHIINGKIPRLYVGLHSDDRAKVKGFAEYMKDKRASLKVDYFCAKSANVWGTPPGGDAASANPSLDLPPS